MPRETTEHYNPLKTIQTYVFPYFTKTNAEFVKNRKRACFRKMPLTKITLTLLLNTISVVFHYK